MPPDRSRESRASCRQATASAVPTYSAKYPLPKPPCCFFSAEKKVSFKKLERHLARRHTNPLKVELPQEFVAGENAVEGRSRLVVFDEIVPHARFFRLREDAPPINRAAADFGHLMIFGHILDVYEREAAGIAVKISKRVLAAFGDPAKIHFHLHELRIGLREKDVVRQLAAEQVFFDEFEGMVVIGKLDARFLADLARAIEGFGSAFPAVRLFANLFVDPRANDVFLADRVRAIQNLGQGIAKTFEVRVGGDSGQAGAVQGGTHRSGRMIEQAGEFDFAIADLGDAGERVLEITLQFAANGIKLQADGFDGAVSGRPTRAGRDQRG